MVLHLVVARRSYRSTISGSMTTVADFVVERLRDAGVRALFGVPGGGGNLDLIEAAGRIGLPFVLTTTESAAAIAALAQAELTGRAGACLTTLGPGAASVVNGVACAFLDRAPLVVFTDTYAAQAASTFEHQRIDHAALFRGITKASLTLTDDGAARILDQALATAVAPPPGPVHVDWPGDTGRAAMRPVRDRYDADSIAYPQADAHSLISRSRRPLLVAGLGARSAADAAAIRRLCERQCVPAMVTYKAKGVVPDDHPWFAGVFTNAAIERPLLDESDLLIAVGLDPVELLPRPWRAGPSIVYCGAWPVAARHVPFGAQIVAGIPAALDEIGRSIRECDWDQAAVRRLVDEQQRAIRIPAAGLTAHTVVDIAARRLAGVARVTVDAGAHMFPATIAWPVSEPNGMLISNGLSTMGFALPAAVGAALIDRDRPVVALTGDGGLLMCVGELLTAVRERLRIVVIVFSDASLSLIEIKQQARQYQPSGVALGAVDWRALAGSLGVAPFLATTDVELGDAIEQALACSGPSLIEATIDRSNYGATLRAVRG
jgi:acetolactate synthase-1/2/3 large subunit